MSERQESQRTVYASRADWHADQDMLVQEITQRLTDLAIADFEHQVLPRGLGMYAALGEAKESVSVVVDDIKEKVENNLASHYLMKRAELRGSRS